MPIHRLTREQFYKFSKWIENSISNIIGKTPRQIMELAAFDGFNVTPSNVGDAIKAMDLESTIWPEGRRKNSAHGHFGNRVAAHEERLAELEADLHNTNILVERLYRLLGEEVSGASKTPQLQEIPKL